MAFAVLEADNLGAVGRYVNSIAIVQEFKVTPVQNVSEVVEMAKAIMDRANR